MKRIALALLSLLCASPLFADAGQHLIPAGSLISCTTSEPTLNSRTTAVGDPVLCQLGYSERYGRSVLPYNSYLVGRFEDYKDPGHFVGKGWMELKFDRMVIEPDMVIPIDARVVDVPGYRVDNQGRILGKGHAVRDTVMWSIPILWPVDLLMLPARGPRPTLKEETRLTLKVMDDLEVPDTTGPQRDIYGLSHRQPDAENAPPPAPYPDQDQPPQMAYAPPDQQEAQPQPDQYAYAPPVVPPPPVYAYAPAYIVPPVMPYIGIGIGRAVYGYGYGARVGVYGYGGPRVYGGIHGYAAAPRAYAYGAAPRAYGAASYGAGRGVMVARAGGGMGVRGGGFRR